MANEKYINIQDQDSHWYYIPESLKDEFVALDNDEAGIDWFIEKFSDYRTGGGPHKD